MKEENIKNDEDKYERKKGKQKELQMWIKSRKKIKFESTR